jgi:Carbohydrate-selective porin
MRLLFVKAFVFFFLSVFSLPIYSQPDSTRFGNAISFEASYVGDAVANMHGGIKTGATYLGLANFKLGFDTEKAGLWRGGLLLVNLGNTHGGEPSATLVGDFQGVSNIEAGDLTFLYELWYEQQVGQLLLTLGLQDLNASFAVCESAMLFTNSSFGIQSSIANNIPAPLFPLTALGANLHWQITPLSCWKIAIYDGLPDNVDSNPYNVRWKLNATDGALLVSELTRELSWLGNHKGYMKMGGYFHSHKSSIPVVDSDALPEQNYGFYLIADQEIRRRTDGSGCINFFLQLGVSPKKENCNNRYVGVGLTFKGFFPSRRKDEFGVALAYAGFHNATVGEETALECSYRVQLLRSIYLKPTMEYVIHPAGTDTWLSDALVGALRIGFAF